MTISRAIWVALICLPLLAGCIPIGTTSSGESVEAQPVSTSDISARPATAAFQAESEAIFNGIRAVRGLRPVVFDEKLYLAARDHAEDMVLQGYRSHRGSDGSSFRGRAARRDAGCAVAENISWGASAPAGAFEWWQGSPSHNRAMLRRDVRRFGLAEVNRVWVLVMGRSC